MTKKRILIVSDLLGVSCDINKYKFFDGHEVDILSSPLLAKIETSELTKDEVHKKFTNGGIETATNQILTQKRKKIDLAIGFSIGGLLLWQAISKGLIVTDLVCISSTRLRYEETKPKCNILLFNGEKDPYAPTDNWIKKLDVSTIKLPNQEHEFYKEPKNLELILKKLTTSQSYN